MTIQVSGWRPRDATRNERSSEIHVWTHARCEMYAQTFVQVLQRGTRAQLEFSKSKHAERELDGAALDVTWMDLFW